MLPDGWTIERVRAVAEGAAEFLPLEIVTVLDDPSGQVPLTPSAIINFSGLCLVRHADDGLWYMGHLRPDRTIVC